MQSRQSIDLRQQQQLALTPQLQQSIRFLQISAQELEQELARALMENPVLELEEEYDIDAVRVEPVNEANEPDERPVLALFTRQHTYADEGFSPPEGGAATTLAQHLLGQLHATHLSFRDRALVTLLIEELDENGYLPTSLEEMAEYLPPELAVEVDELHTALSLLQSFDPLGVGARSLSDCLLLQLKSRADGVEPRVWACASQLVQYHLELLAGGNLARLREALGCSQDELKAAHSLLLELNPKPARQWAIDVADYVRPEIIVRKARGGWQARINPAVMPRLSVNRLYERWIKDDRQSDEPAVIPDPPMGLDDVPYDVKLAGQTSLLAHVQQAHGVVKSVAQRFETILRVAQIVVRRQQAFFEQGVQAMRPLVLRDIAQELEMHESTVSRATRKKYIQTPWGVFELRYFFGSALSTDDGQDASSTAVRSLIQSLILAESAGKPLSDNKIAIKLAEQGVIIARRTVAKYREEAGIKTALARKAALQLAQPGKDTKEHN